MPIVRWTNDHLNTNAHARTDSSAMESNARKQSLGAMSSTIAGNTLNASLTKKRVDTDANVMLSG